MAKTYLSHSKYIIHQKFEIKGVVDKHDIIGAIFGQSEGIIGEDLDLRELQSSGKIGRIECELTSKNGVTNGMLTIPSGSDMVETSILAATIEIVDKVGPCDAKFETVKIEDTRVKKRQHIVSRAKELLSRLITDEIPDSQEIANEVRSEVRTSELKEYGFDKLASGPAIEDSEEVILVEGRADVINLLKYNIRNVIAIGGSKIGQTIIDLSKRKTIIAFMDGDRGGELDLKKLLQIAQIDYVTRAPLGKEVEELTKKEILAALSKKIPVVQTKSGPKLADDIEIDDNYWKNEDNSLDVSSSTNSEIDISIEYKPKDNIIQKNVFPKNDLISTDYTNKKDVSNDKSYNKGYSSYQNKDRYNSYKDNRSTYGSRSNSYNNRSYSSRSYYPQNISTANNQVSPAVIPEQKQIPAPLSVPAIIPAVENISEKMEKNVEIIAEKPLENIMHSSDLKIDYKKIMGELKGTLKARIFDDNLSQIGECEVKDILHYLKDKKSSRTVIFDGIITKRLAELAKSKGARYLIGSKIGKMSKIKGIELIEYSS